MRILVGMLLSFVFFLLLIQIIFFEMINMDLIFLEQQRIENLIIIVLVIWRL